MPKDPLDAVFDAKPDKGSKVAAEPATPPEPAAAPPEAPEDPAAPPAAELPAAAQEPPLPFPPVAPDDKGKPPQGYEIPIAKYLDTRDQLKAVQEELRAIRQHLQQQQKRVEAPDPLQDPAAYAAHVQQTVLGEVQQTATNNRMNVSEMMAIEKHGQALVDEAFEALLEAEQRDPTIRQRFFAARHPWGEVVNWYRREKVMSQIGDDPDEFVRRRYAELQAQPNGGSPPPAAPPAPGQPRRAPVQSLSGAPASHQQTGHVPVGPGQAFDGVFKPE